MRRSLAEVYVRVRYAGRRWESCHQTIAKIGLKVNKQFRTFNVWTEYSLLIIQSVKGNKENTYKNFTLQIGDLSFIGIIVLSVYALY